MNSQDVVERLNGIKNQALGTYNGSIIKLVDMLCDIIGDLCEELNDVKGCTCDAKLSMPEVPDEFLGPHDNVAVPETKLSEPKDLSTKGTAKKGTTPKAKKSTRGDR